MPEGQKLISSESLAATLGILSVCAVDRGSSYEQQRAQHDVIGAAFLRLQGFRETVGFFISSCPPPPPLPPPPLSPHTLHTPFFHLYDIDGHHELPICQSEYVGSQEGCIFCIYMYVCVCMCECVCFQLIGEKSRVTSFSARPFIHTTHTSLAFCFPGLLFLLSPPFLHSHWQALLLPHRYPI